MDGEMEKERNVGYLPANTVESHQAKQICKADPRTIKRKGYKQMKDWQIEL